ncbi:Immunoglobulin superfamily containing leucine-rich repeat protein [Intoshia linei]|uniref:Immunoglobulin superfamily containing leucine-rich repeat protein n=1 Tax=Intoshia linei TaxID=1819745 RepID=A0A177AZH9_9BILA|nr:Immunoglobulin superfamily containing leucine-rich repeat protein [Intoshia linei]
MLKYVFFVFLLKNIQNQCVITTILGQKTASCENHHLNEIPSSIDADITILRFNDNNLVNLYVNMFSRYTRLQELDLSNNKIESIAENAFGGLYHLRILSLKGNNLESIPKLGLSNLKKIDYLNIESNPITHIESQDLTVLTSLKQLNLANCKIKWIDYEWMEGLVHLNEINISKNRIIGLSHKMEKYFPSTLKVLRLHDNPWSCTCHLKWLKKFLTKSNHKLHWKFSINIPKCNSPINLQNKRWDEIDYLQFACPPKITNGYNETIISASPGETINIKCNANGDPRPNITWAYDATLHKGIDKNEKKINTTSNEITSLLVIKNITLNDFQMYHCKAIQDEKKIFNLNNATKTIIPNTVQSKNSIINKKFVIGMIIGISILLSLSCMLMVCVIFRKYNDHKIKKKLYGNKNKSIRRNNSDPGIYKTKYSNNITGILEKNIESKKISTFKTNKIITYHNNIMLDTDTTFTPTEENISKNDNVWTKIDNLLHIQTEDLEVGEDNTIATTAIQIIPYKENNVKILTTHSIKKDMLKYETVL